MSFDLLAPIYGWMERVSAGDKMQRCRTAFLDELPACHDILILGEGHGRFLRACILRFPEARITCVDASAGMIEAASRFLKSGSVSTENVRFIQADILEWSPPPDSFDLIVTHFFLDCFTAAQIAELVPRIALGARPEAAWLLADFELAPAGWRRLRTRAILALMYLFFRVITKLPARELTPPDAFLQSAGFRRYRRIEAEWGLLKSEWWKR